MNRSDFNAFLFNLASRFGPTTKEGYLTCCPGTEYILFSSGVRYLWEMLSLREYRELALRLGGDSRGNDILPGYGDFTSRAPITFVWAQRADCKHSPLKVDVLVRALEAVLVEREESVQEHRLQEQVA